MVGGWWSCFPDVTAVVAVIIGGVVYKMCGCVCVCVCVSCMVRQEGIVIESNGI